MKKLHCVLGATLLSLSLSVMAQVGYNQVGNQTYYNNGVTASQVGNQTYYSNGVTANQVGNQTYYSNGKSCNQVGDQMYCN